MGSIVGGFGTAHILMKRGSGGEAGERVFAGMKRIGQLARTLRPDLMVVVSSDHLYNFNLRLQAPLTVAVDAEFTTFGDLGLAPRRLPGQREFATDFVRFAAQRDFDLAVAEAYRPDHGVLLPSLMISPDSRIPVVPLIVNTAMHTAASARRCWQLGQALGAFVATRPAAERVIVVGTGGLSHWLGLADMGRINAEFDLQVLRAFESGAAEELTRLSNDTIVAEGGNGGLELLCWLVMGGATAGMPATRVYYEAVQAWITGMGGVAVIPE